MRQDIIGEWNAPIMVEVASLIIDDGDSDLDYQRTDSKLFLVWDYSLYDPIRVANRNNNGMHVIDGARRVRNAKRFNIEELPAFVRMTSDASSEAVCFRTVAQIRKNLSARNRFKADVVAKDRKSLELYNTIKELGFFIGEGKVWPSIRTVTGLLRYETESIKYALEVISDVWNGNNDALLEPVITGIAGFHAKHKSENINRDKLIRKLSMLDPKIIVQRASAFDSAYMLRYTVYAQVVESIYNKRK